MKDLYTEVNSWNLADNFELLFKINNVGKGWDIINKVDTHIENKNILVRYTALAYSYNSKLLRAKKDRLQNKINILNFLGVTSPDDFMLDCIKNKNEKFNKYITWWLRENEDRDFAMIISGEDLMFDLLETARDGVEKVVTAKDEKQAERVMKSFTRMEVNMKGDAYDKAMKIKSELIRQTKELEKNYDYLLKVVREDSDELSSNIGFAERNVLKRKYR